MTVYDASTWVIPVIIAITFHEAAHGFVALFFGDDTAWSLGRVSFNPLKHIDPFGTILMPALLLLLRSPFVFGDLRTCPNPRDRRCHWRYLGIFASPQDAEDTSDADS